MDRNYVSPYRQRQPSSKSDHHQRSFASNKSTKSNKSAKSEYDTGGADGEDGSNESWIKIIKSLIKLLPETDDRAELVLITTHDFSLKYMDFFSLLGETPINHRIIEAYFRLLRGKSPLGLFASFKAVEKLLQNHLVELEEMMGIPVMPPPNSNLKCFFPVQTNPDHILLMVIQYEKKCVTVYDHCGHQFTSRTPPVPTILKWFKVENLDEWRVNHYNSSSSPQIVHSGPYTIWGVLYELAGKSKDASVSVENWQSTRTRILCDLMSLRIHSWREPIKLEHLQNVTIRWNYWLNMSERCMQRMPSMEDKYVLKSVLRKKLDSHAALMDELKELAKEKESKDDSRTDNRNCIIS